MWNAPHATTTARARTCTGPASTPIAAPRSTRTRCCANADEHARACCRRVGEPRLGSSALRTERAAEAAVPADAVLVAAAHVSRLRTDVPAERLCSALEHAIAPGSRSVLLVDVHPLLDRIEAARELVGRERGDAVRRPLLSHVVRRPKRGRPVHRRPAAETPAREKVDRLVLRRGRCTFEVEPVQRVDLLAAERCSLACFEHDDVQACRCQNACGRAAARAGADDAHVAVEAQLAAHALGLERQRGAGVLEPARVAERRASRTRQSEVVVQHSLAEHLVRRPLALERAVAPRLQNDLALGLRQRREAPSAAAPRAPTRRAAEGCPEPRPCADAAPTRRRTPRARPPRSRPATRRARVRTCRRSRRAQPAAGARAPSAPTLTRWRGSSWSWSAPAASPSTSGAPSTRTV